MEMVDNHWPDVLVWFEWGSDNWYGSHDQFAELMAGDDAPDWEPDTDRHDLVRALSDEYALYRDMIHPGNGRMVSTTNPRVPRWTLFGRDADGQYTNIATYDADPLIEREEPVWIRFNWETEVKEVSALLA
jgi:hypothetical protein